MSLFTTIAYNNLQQHRDTAHLKHRNAALPHKSHYPNIATPNHPACNICFSSTMDDLNTCVDRYWKIYSGSSSSAGWLRDHLERKGFRSLKSTHSIRLRALYKRAQRGLMSCEGLPLEELKFYAAQRGLPPNLGPYITVNVLKAQLEDADDEATFDYLPKLPPELRGLIYTYYFNSLDRGEEYAETKRQPPIALVSRETRKESLPLFYECCSFTLRTTAPYQAPPHENFANALKGESAAFIDSIVPDNLARIKFFYLVFADQKVSLTLDLTNQDNVISVDLYERWRWYSRGERTYQEAKDRLSSELRKIGTGIATREGPLKLRKNDLEVLYDTVRSILKDSVI